MMLKALLKKQFLELNQFYFQDRKTGKSRTRAGIIRYVALYGLLLIFLGVAFGVLATSIASTLLSMELDWLYFCLMGLLAIFFGVFGSVFNTYAGLYLAKDNDLLLSMPIPPAKILLVRMVGVYAMGLMYESLVLVPAIIVYWIIGAPTVLGVIFPILLVFILNFFVLSLTCALGWVVALISTRLKNKSYITVFLSLAFFAVYYFCYFRLTAYLQEFALHAEKIGATVKRVLYPFYQLGRAACGNVGAMVIVTVLIAALFALTYNILTRSFQKIVTTKIGEKRAVYTEQPVKAASASAALLRKERLRFTSSPTYMLNCGLGIVMAPLIAILLLVKIDAIREAVAMIFASAPQWQGVIPVAAAGITCILASMIDITAPSVSLEGKSLWIVQSLPVEPWEVLQAKLKLHQLLAEIPALLCVVVLGYVLEVEWTTGLFMAIVVALFVMLSAAGGLAINLLKPNLTWTNETAPVKQSIGVFIQLLGGWLAAIAFVAIYCFVAKRLDAQTYLGILIVLFALATRFLNRWLRNKGAKIFASL